MSSETTAQTKSSWNGQWVTDRLGVELITAVDSDLDLSLLVGIALRNNPNRAQLLVSTVLGKHVPTDARIVQGAGQLLGLAVAQQLTGRVEDWDEARRLLAAALAGDPAAPQQMLELCAAHGTPLSEAGSMTVLGYAETATALGHCVAEFLGVDYLHSTRRPVHGTDSFGTFEESHSHATSHLLLPENPQLLLRSGALVLVDDELSTGSTAVNTIEMLHSISPRERYVIATLVDLRDGADVRRMQDVAARLGVPIDVVALGRGHLVLPGDIRTRAADVLAPGSEAHFAPVRDLRKFGSSWPAGVRESGRHGFTPADHLGAQDAARSVTHELVSELAGDRVIVLGFEELMYAPLLIALELAAELDAVVRYSTTSRSPVRALDADGYAIRTALTFASHDDPADGAGARHAYNLRAGDQTDIVLVVDQPADTAPLHADHGLLAQLSKVGDRVHLVTLPSYRPPSPLRGPGFGSYEPDDVAWLLTDLSAHELEAPTEEREEAIQSGGAHYAESLPVEYQPDAEYQQLYTAALAQSAGRVALAIGVVTELILAERGPDVVLVSLARAGTPVGILMRRWAAFAHHLDLPHYAVSIVRGRGIDLNALNFLAGHHRPGQVLFVDGWTGKGAIARELSAALVQANATMTLSEPFRDQIAVLADPGSCVDVFGTREDYLIPSACLNSTVSGLVSRTVLNDLIGAGQFHGAKFYRALAGADVSRQFVDSIEQEFPTVLEEVVQQWPMLRDSDRTPTWAGWAAVEAISAEYGIDNINLIKPGVGETTRVLLRRVPWKILVRRDALAELGHVRLLAQRRGVDVVEVDELPYSCVGLIHPKFTRGATGADGRAT